jgi:hypothetical protein
MVVLSRCPSWLVHCHNPKNELCLVSRLSRAILHILANAFCFSRRPIRQGFTAQSMLTRTAIGPASDRGRWFAGHFQLRGARPAATVMPTAPFAWSRGIYDIVGQLSSQSQQVHAGLQCRPLQLQEKVSQRCRFPAVSCRDGAADGNNTARLSHRRPRWSWDLEAPPLCPAAQLFRGITHHAHSMARMHVSIIIST